ncbi:PGF-CTERM sorting domain-containing protein [Haladaptatus sp. CMAA 1911]|uniref:PGF-CTERM sorting domain-containing protein n=1 Tax=unclassified Haladaptatus TaxID=2622732 RepID=UPI00375410D4
MNKSKILSIFLVGILITSAFGVVQADNGKDKGKDGKHAQKAVFEVEKMTIHNWSFYVGPDDSPDRTVYVDPVSIKDKTFKLNAKKMMKGGGMSEMAAMPAKKKAMAQAKEGIDRKKGETIRICIKSIEVENVKVVAKLPKMTPKMMQKMSSDQQSSMSDAPQLPSYKITIHRMNIDRWSFVVGAGEPKKTITLGDVSLEDKTIPLGGSSMDEQQSSPAMQSVQKQIQDGMMKKGAKMGSTYRIVIQNVHLKDVTLAAGGSDEMDDSEDTQTTTTDEEMTTTEDEKKTTTEEEMTTTEDSSNEGGSGSDGEETTNSSGQPGFGIGIAVIACLAAALLATRNW